MRKKVSPAAELIEIQGLRVPIDHQLEGIRILALALEMNLNAPDPDGCLYRDLNIRIQLVFL